MPSLTGQVAGKSIFNRLFGFFKKTTPRTHPREEGRIRGNRREEGIRESRFKLEELSLKREAKEAKKLERAQEDPEYRFLIQGEWLETPQSTYMTACFYELDKQTLHVIHHDHSMYGYSQVSPDMARSLFRAGSKGVWMWDNIRIRGTVYGHRVPYWLEMQPSAEFTPGRGEGPYGARKWASSVETAMERDREIQRLGGFRQVERQEGGKTFSTLMSKFARKTPLGNSGRRIKVGPPSSS